LKTLLIVLIIGSVIGVSGLGVLTNEVGLDVQKLGVFPSIDTFEGGFGCIDGNGDPLTYFDDTDIPDEIDDTSDPFYNPHAKMVCEWESHILGFDESTSQTVTTSLPKGPHFSGGSGGSSSSDTPNSFSNPWGITTAASGSGNSGGPGGSGGPLVFDGVISFPGGSGGSGGSASLVSGDFGGFDVGPNDYGSSAFAKLLLSESLQEGCSANFWSTHNGYDSNKSLWPIDLDPDYKFNDMFSTIYVYDDSGKKDSSSGSEIVACEIDPAVVPDSTTFGTGEALEECVVIGSDGTFGTNVTIKKHTIIGDNAVVGDTVTIEVNGVIGNNFKLGDDSSIKENADIGNDVTILTNVAIEKNVVIGDGATLEADVIVEKNSIIPAGLHYGLDGPSPTLQELLEIRGGEYDSFIRESIAALLNAASDDVEYKYSVPKVIEMTQKAIVSGDYSYALEEFTEYNNLGGSPLCPVS